MTNQNPFLLIGPIKQEEVFDKPQIWIYYDVINENQIEVFKKLASPKVNIDFFVFLLKNFNSKKSKKKVKKSNSS